MGSVGARLSIMATRYFVSNVEASLEFYTLLLGFELLEKWGPACAIVAKNGQTLWLSGPETSAARPMPDGRRPEPGGWNRIVVEVSKLGELATSLRESGVSFRGEVITGPGGSQCLIEDPDGNPIELFEGR
jgi:catechol 2,3-dioxygenase-like lactoylglutathione lyase family enzyme